MRLRIRSSRSAAAASRASPDAGASVMIYGRSFVVTGGYLFTRHRIHERMRGKAIIETFPVGALQCNCIILGDDRSKTAVVIDPGDDVDRVTAALERLW